MLPSPALATFALALASAATAHHHPHMSPAQRGVLQHARSTCVRSVHCILAEEAVEGPYYVAQPLVRSNITEDREGIPFSLAINVLNVSSCAPVPRVFVDVWHADAFGVYSGWASGSLLSASAPPLTASGMPRDETRWLRGVQETDADGTVRFWTVWPGWYRGRSTHIHLRIHTGNVTLSEGILLGNGRTAHTGQLFFSDAFVTNVSKTREPYKTKRNTLRPLMNGDDGIFLDSKGGEQIVDIEEESGIFYGMVTVGINPDADHPEHGPGPHFPFPPHFHPNSLWILMAIVLCCAALWYFWTIFLSRKEQRTSRRQALLVEHTDRPISYGTAG